MHENAWACLGEFIFSTQQALHIDIDNVQPDTIIFMNVGWDT